MFGCKQQTITGRFFVGRLFCSIRLKVQLDTVRIKHVYTSAVLISDAVSWRGFYNNMAETLFLSYKDM
jgi:hypothetical protein